MLIKNWLKQIYKKKFAATLLLFFALSSSCTDQGCIDADDFGEYETQTVEVSANASQDNCTYDASKELNDPAGQGSGVYKCFTEGNVPLTDENGVSKSSSSGCNGFSDAKFRNLCVNNCVQACLTNVGGGGASPEPNWNSTSKKITGSNSGVTIRPGSEITIRAVGSVRLGDSIDYPKIYIHPTEHTPHARNSVGGNIFFDVNNSQTLNLKFSGYWNDGSTQIGSGSTPIDSNTFNGAKRAVAYLIPHPAGYDFDFSKTDELTGTKGVPLLPDAVAWNCSYSGADKKESNCSNKPTGYKDSGYTNANDELINGVFPISSSFRTTGLTQYGGMIRWSGDGLENDNFDPVANVVCDPSSGSCSNLNGVSPEQGQILGDTSAGNVVITNSYQNAYKVSFKSLTTDTQCNVNYKIKVAKSDDTILYDFGDVAVNNSSWSTKHISLEPNQKLVILRMTTNSGGGKNCGMLTGIRFGKYHDIKIEKSGFLKFTMLRGSGASCTFKGRIINPEGSHEDKGAITADFYEYDPFSITETSNDPLGVFIVPASSSVSLAWSGKVFLRKGQVIRFSPESWNGTWLTESGLDRQCGIGTAMIIEPRPALLCRGRATELIMNPACTPDYNNTPTLLGCRLTAPECNNTSSSAYCPITECQKTITCSPGTAPLYRKSCILPGTRNDSSKCTIPNGGYTEATCESCKDLMLENGTRAAKIEKESIDQCYDLENYKGKISNISASTSQTQSQVDAFLADVTKAKGAVRLSNFSGSYGNLENFGDTGKLDSGNRVFQIKTPLIFTKAGRLKFFMLDGTDFNNRPITSSTGAKDAYGDNSGSGFKISLFGALEFSNGQWLQARLCKESSDSSLDCKGFDPAKVGSTVVSYTPKIVEITPPNDQTPAGTPPAISSGYKFNDYGTLVRTLGGTIIEDSKVVDCTLSTTGVNTQAGSFFYCHTSNYFSVADLKAKKPSERDAINATNQKLRLTFKIFDPEVGNCTIDDPNDGLKLSNPFYDSQVSGNAGQICAKSEIPGSLGCKKEFYCGNKYSNNSGKYYVGIKVKSSATGNVSSIIGGVITPVVEVMDGPKDGSKMGQAERIYKLLIADPRYKAILSMCLVLMFAFYGVGYTMGTSDLNHSEIFNRIIRIGLIYLMVGETGWYWFDKIVVKFFKNGTDYLAFMMASSFDNSPEVATAIASGDYYDKSILFNGVDRVFSMFFSQAVQKKISALLFASIFGWAYLIIIYQSFMLYVYAVANAVLLYLTAQVFMSILFTLGPIFFIFTLFAQTKEMFDSWLKQLMGFSLQQIFLLTTLAFFNMLMYEVIKMSLGYKICWDEVWTINIITRVTLLSFWTIASLPPRTNAQSEVGNIGNPEGIPSLFSILFIWVIASLMNKFITFMTDLAASMAGGLTASSLGKGMADFAKGAQAAISKKADKLWDETAGKAIQRVDQKLFDSGKLADDEREKRKKQNSADISNKSALSKAASSAISNYKKEHGAEFAAMSKEEQRAKLAEIKQTAMINKGKELKLDEKDVKRLQEEKGLKYEGTNLFGAGMQALKQGVKSGGTFRKSLSEQETSAKFSSSEAKAAMSKMNEKERAGFIDAATKGKIEVGTSRTDKAISAVGHAVMNPRETARIAAKAIESGWNTTKTAAGKAKEAVTAAPAAIGKAASEAKAATVAKAKNAVAAIKAAPAAIGKAASEAKAATVAKAQNAAAAIKAVPAAAKQAMQDAKKSAVQAKDDIKYAATHKRETALKAKEAIKEAGRSAATGAKKAASKAGASAAKGAMAAKKQLGSAAKTVDKAVSNKDYDEAAQQLEKEGLVSQMGMGTSWSRSDSEKKLIRERQKQNMAQKKADVKAISPDALAQLKAQDEYQKDVDAINPDAGIVEKTMGRAAASIKKTTESATRFKAEAKKESREGVKTNVARELGQAKAGDAAGSGARGELERLTAAREAAMADVRATSQEMKAHTQSPEFTQRQDKIRGLQDVVKAGKEKGATAEAKQKAKAASKELAGMTRQGDSKLSDIDARHKKANVAVSQLDAQRGNVQAKVDRFEATQAAIPKAEAIRDRAIKAAGMDGTPLEQAPRSATHQAVRASTVAAIGTAQAQQSGLSASRAATVAQRNDKAAQVKALSAQSGNFWNRTPEQKQALQDNKGTIANLKRDIKQDNKSIAAIDKRVSASKKAERGLQKSLKAVDKSGGILDKAARAVATAGVGTKEHKAAQKTIEKYEAAKTAKDFKKFAAKRGGETVAEKKAKRVSDRYDGLRSSNDFESFTKKFGDK